MVEQLRPLRSEEFSDQQQAAFFHSRERRKSLAGIPELHRTQSIRGSGGISVTSLDTGALFPTSKRSGPITMKTAIRFSSGVQSGLVFGFGDATSSMALWVDGQLLQFRAGSTGVDAGTAIFDNGAAFPDGLELDVVVSALPGFGRVQMWLNGRPDVINDISNSGDFGTPLQWSSGAAGSFASAAAGPLTSDITQTGAPTNFEVIEGLSVYTSQLPRQFYR